MENKISKFVDILKVELKDLEGDIAFLKETLNQRAQDKEITHFVHLENSALLQREISLVREALKDLHQFDYGKYDNLDDFIADLTSYFDENLDNVNFPKAVQIFLARKINKVKEYMALES